MYFQIDVSVRSPLHLVFWPNLLCNQGLLLSKERLRKMHDIMSCLRLQVTCFRISVVIGHLRSFTPLLALPQSTNGLTVSKAFYHLVK